MEKQTPERPDAKHRAYVLRTCNADFTAYGGFQWPKEGYVEAPDWDPAPHCGNGLHGALWGEGDSDLLSDSAKAKWLVVEVDTRTVVDLCRKVKFPHGWVVYCGDRKGATAEIRKLGARGPVIGEHVVTGFYGTAIVGERGTAVAGQRGTAVAGRFGKATVGTDGIAVARYGQAEAGFGGVALAASNGFAVVEDCGIAITGDRGAAKAKHYSRAISGINGTSAAGEYSTAYAGQNGKVSAGTQGKLMLDYRLPSEARTRTAVAYVGEEAPGKDGPILIEADTYYSIVVTYGRGFFEYRWYWEARP